MTIITLKDNAELLNVVRRVAPKYRKHNAIVKEADSFTNHGTYWGGGSQLSHYLVNARSVTPVHGPTAPPQFGGGEPVAIPVPVGSYIVSVGTFQGKTATASIVIGTAKE